MVLHCTLTSPFSIRSTMLPNSVNSSESDIVNIPISRDGYYKGMMYKRRGDETTSSWELNLCQSLRRLRGAVQSPRIHTPWDRGEKKREQDRMCCATWTSACVRLARVQTAGCNLTSIARCFRGRFEETIRIVFKAPPNPALRCQLRGVASHTPPSCSYTY